MRFGTALFVAFGAALGACIPADVDLSGKSCPCATGFVCDEATGTCVTPGTPASDAGVSAGDGGAADAAMPAVCRTDFECDPPRTICRSGRCAPACGTEDGLRCQPGETCDPDSGRCFRAGACASPVECGPGGPPFVACLDGQCRLGCATIGERCEGNRTCSGTGACTVAPDCTEDSDCGDPEFVCADTYCKRRCDVPGAFPCAGVSTCNPSTGRCEGERTTFVGGECRQNFECVTGYCLGLVNGDRFCTRYCGASQDCPLGFTCTELGAGPDSARTKECVRTTAEGDQITPAGQACEGPTDDACQSNLCEENVCGETCTRDEHCLGLGGTCQAQPVGATRMSQVCAGAVGDPPGVACTANDACASGICDPDRQVCARPCCANADCGAGEHCTSFEWRPNYPAHYCRPLASPGIADLGANCTTNDQCASGLCGRRFSSTASNQMCTTTCCTDADCADLPGGPGLCLGYFGADTDGDGVKRCVEDPS